MVIPISEKISNAKAWKISDLAAVLTYCCWDNCRHQQLLHRWHCCPWQVHKYMWHLRCISSWRLFISSWGPHMLWLGLPWDIRTPELIQLWTVPRSAICSACILWLSPSRNGWSKINLNNIIVQVLSYVPQMDKSQSSSVDGSWILPETLGPAMFKVSAVTVTCIHEPELPFKLAN